MESSFENKLKEVLEIKNHDVAMSDMFREYEEWDSLAYLSVIAFLDEDYDIQIEEAEFKKLKTVEELYNITIK